MHKPTLHLIKIGGNIIDDEQAVEQVLKQICMFNEPFILVHGGGKVATNLCETLLIETTLIDGRRVTDAATLEIVTMVYAGLINKKLVAQLQAQGKNAIGLSGADANIIPAIKRSITPIDYGFVGDLDANTIGVNSLEVLLKNNMIPVVSSITHDGNGQLLNTNADTIAATLAMAMSKIYNTKLYLCFEKKGVLTDANQTDAVLPTLNESRYYTLKENGTINKGMIPKVDNAFAALKQGVSQVFIMHALDLTNTENAAGTQLVIG
ncbi:MAG: acetylglutamate kinase [Bacteroidia bacterium]